MSGKVGVIPGLGGAPKYGSSPVGASKITGWDPKVQALIQAIQHVNDHPMATPAQDVAAGAAAAQGINRSGGLQVTGSNEKGVDWTKMPLDAKTLMISRDSMLHDIGQQPSHPHGFWHGVVNVLNRPLSTISNAAEKTFEDVAAHGLGLHNLAAAGKGAVSGAMGHNNTDIGGFIQEMADVKKAQHDHPDLKGDALIQYAKEHRGSAHAGLAAGIGGFVGDVLLDPLTYTGVGKAAKLAGEGADALTIERATQIADNAVKKGLAPNRETALTYLGVDPKNMTSQATSVFKGKKYVQKSELLTPAQREGVVQHSLPFLEDLAQANTHELKIALHGLPVEAYNTALQTAVATQFARTPWLQRFIDQIHLSSDINTTGMASVRYDSTLDRLMRNFNTRKIEFTTKLGDPKYVADAVNFVKKHTWFSTDVNKPEEFLYHVATHELGHHIGFLFKPADIIRVKNMVMKEFNLNSDLEFRRFIAQNLSRYPVLGGHMLTEGKDLDSRLKRTQAMWDEIFADSWAEHQLTENARPLAKLIGSEMERKGEHFAQQHGWDTFKSLKHEDIHGELMDILQRNLAPDLERAIQIRFAGKSILNIPTERLAKFVENYTKGDGRIARINEHFENAFRSAKGMDPLMHHIRQSAMGHAHEYNRAKINVLRRAFGGLSTPDRRSVVDAYRHGISPEGHPLGNQIKYFNRTVRRIQKAITKDGEGAIHSLHELQPFLPQGFKLDDDLIRSHPENWLEQHIKTVWPNRLTPTRGKYPEVNDPGKMLYALDSALNMAVGRRAMWENLGKTYGHKLEKGMARPFAINSDGKRVAYRKVTYVGKHGDTELPYLKGHVFHPDIAKAMNKFHEIVASPKSTDYWMQKYFEPATRAFKAVVTKFNPGFHERNLMGEVMQNFYAGVKDVNVYKQAATVLHSWGRGGLRGAEKNAARANMVLKDAPSYTSKTIKLRRAVTLPNGETTKYVPVDVLMDLYQRNGLRTGWYSEFDDALGMGGGIKQVLGAANQGVQHLTENIEDFARMAHFIDGLNKGTYRDVERAAEEAAMQVRKFHFDYTDFTPFEKRWMANVFPFYKWTRKNIPLQIEMLLTHPGRIGLIPKAESALARIMGYTNNESDTYLPGADLVVPDWMREEGAFPVGTAPTGNTRYLIPPLPQSQAFTALQPGNLPVGGFLGKIPIPGLDQMGAMLTPFVKDPIELQTGKKIGGGQISDSNKYLSATNPFTNLLYGLTSGKPGDPVAGSSGLNNTKLLQFLLGIGLQENTPAYMQSQLKREQQVASAKRKAYEKKHGTFQSTNHPGVK